MWCPNQKASQSGGLISKGKFAVTVPMWSHDADSMGFADSYSCWVQEIGWVSNQGYGKDGWIRCRTHGFAASLVFSFVPSQVCEDHCSDFCTSADIFRIFRGARDYPTFLKWKACSLMAQKITKKKYPVKSWLFAEFVVQTSNPSFFVWYFLR